MEVGDRDATLLDRRHPFGIDPKRLGRLAARWVDARLGQPGVDESDVEDEAPPGWKACLAVLIVYMVALAVATYPRIASIGNGLPWDVDPVTHLTVMRWYKTCLVEGRSPFLLDGIQHPFGATLGSFPPMVLQTLAYVVLSTSLGDLPCYNLLWVIGFLLAGVGTFSLAYRVVGDAGCAAFAGLTAMLSGPIMMHAHGHLELIYVGWFAPFLIGWTRLVDRPGGRALAAASAGYALITLSAGYFAVLAAVPAAWYLAMGATGAARRGDWGWLGRRAGWLAGFAALVAPFLLLTFSGQIWNLAHGLAMVRSKAEFSSFGVPWYGYVVPTAGHPLGRLIGGGDAYDALDRPGIECASYLGVATLGLILYGAIRRVRFRRSSFWWSATILLMVLSFGSSIMIRWFRVDLPGSWLYDHCFAFRLLRAPARFNLLAAVTAAVVASAALKDLIGRLPGPAARRATCGALMAVAVADLSMVPFPARPVARVPAFYGELLRGDPAATFLEAPMHPSGAAHPLGAATGYWQSSHRGRTTGGYSAHPNLAFDNQLVHNSPFSSRMMASSDYLADRESARFGIVEGVRALDHAWLLLEAHDLRYVVIHRDASLVPEPPRNRSRLEDLLGPSRVFEDESAAVFDRDRLPSPRRPVLAVAGGWRGGWHGRRSLVASKVAGLWAYNPDPARDLAFKLKAQSLRKPRTVRLRSGGVELAAWTVLPEIQRTVWSPPFRLPAGLQSLIIESDAEEQPGHLERATQGDERPYSLIVSGVSIRETTPDGVGSPPRR